MSQDVAPSFAAEPAGRQSRPPVVLVVDDDPITQTYVSTLLGRAGYTVEIAADGPAGLARIEAGGIDVVLLDLMLPVLDGLELCRRVRARQSDVYLPIIMLTALDSADDRRAGFAAGADDYVTKPFRADDLLARVQVWAQTRARLRVAHERLQAERATNARLAAETLHALEVTREAHRQLLAVNAREQRLLQEAEARTRTFRALHEVAVAVGGLLDPTALARLVVDRALELLHADGVVFYSHDPEAEGLRVLAHAGRPVIPDSGTWTHRQGAAGQAFARREPVQVEDYAAWPHAVPRAVARGVRAVLAVPLLVGDQAVGALVVHTLTPRRFGLDEVQLLTLLAAQVAPALEAARLYAESERRRAEAEALADLARQGAAEADADRVVSLVTEQACRLVHADFAWVTLAEPDGTLNALGMYGNRREEWRAHATKLRLPGGTGGRALATGRTVLFERLGEDPALPLEHFPIQRSEGGRTALALPLFARGGPFGALVLGWRSDVAITPAQVRLAEALASYAAVIIDHARAHADLAAQAEKLRQLADIAGAITADAELTAVLGQIVHAAARAAGVEQNSILLLDAAGRTLAHAAAVGLPPAYIAAIDGLAIGPCVGTCGTAAFRGETVITEDVLTDPAWEPWRELAVAYGFRAVWSVPLIGKGGRVLGTFAAYREEPGRPTEQQLELLGLYARLAAVAVENAHSYAREEELARQAAARAAELEAVIEQLPSGVIVVDADGRRRLSNQAARRLFGALPPPDQPFAERILRCQPRDPATGRPLAVSELPLARAFSGAADRVEAQEILIRSPGAASDTWIQGSAVPLRDADGRITGAVGVYSDVTRERELTRDLAASEERLRTRYRAMTCGVLVCDAAGRIVDANEAAEEAFGLTLADLAGRALHDFPVVDEDGSVLPTEERPYHIALRTGQPVRHMLLGVRRANGERRWLQIDAVPIRGPDGQVLQIVSSFVDVTARKQAEEERARLAAEIERERATLAAIMTSMSDGLVVLDAAGRVHYCNQQAAALLGVAPQEVVGLHAAEAFARYRHLFADPDTAWAAWQRSAACVTTHPTHEVRVAGPPPRDLLVQLFPVARVGEGGPGIGVVLRDVTGAKLLALLEERERIAMDLHDGVIQSLYAVALGLGAHERGLPPEAAHAREPLRRARAQIGAVIQEIRNYIFDLRPHDLGARSLRAGLAALAEELRVNALLQPELVIDPAADALGPSATAALLQVAREATANVIRHAGASAVRLALERVGPDLVLTISDNGCGFCPRASREEAGEPLGLSGQGLRNMAERARALGGRFTVESAPGRGTVVRIAIPFNGLEERPCP